ncbi:MAG: phosphate ABC transporter permease subunit PstC [Chloroflexi bacterium]|jgi:phosphate transport system permease protein|nr:phosphate ABC transporter permease subunit PstC [Chloroflexota bacterium]
MAQATVDRKTELPGLDLRGSTARRRREDTIRIIFLGAALFSVVISAAIVLTLAFEAVNFLGMISLDQLQSLGWFPRRGMFDIATVMAGSLVVTFIAMAIATPIGLGSAIYLSEYASPRVRRVVKPILEILAGIPSIVLGYFALTVINPDVVARLFSGSARFNMLAAGIAVGVLIIPLVASISEDAMRAVPRSLREASYGLGARRITTSLRVVFPAAISGIVAALIIGVSRAIGETMVVAIAAGATGGSLFGVDPRQPGQTVTAAMATLATGSDQVRGASAAFPSLFFLGLLLFATTLLLNFIGDTFVRRTRQRY